MKVLAVVCLLVGVASALPQFQLGVQPDQAAPSRGPPGGQRAQEIRDTPDPYTFGLEVNDDEFTNYQSRSESQDENGVVRGQYSYVAPNGIRITVDYTADAINGYQAKITEEQTDIIVRNPALAKLPPEPRIAALSGPGRA